MKCEISAHVSGWRTCVSCVFYASGKRMSIVKIVSAYDLLADSVGEIRKHILLSTFLS